MTLAEQMSDKELTACTESEFDAFLAAYPNPLERDVTAICEPPLVTFNDWTRGKWPDSVVASYSLASPAFFDIPATPNNNFRIMK
jgi:hypothetical protein